MEQTRVRVINEVSTVKESGWKLCLQWCEYVYGNNETDMGYRYIWCRPDGTLQPARGQARIPSMADMLLLISEAFKEGWAKE